MSGQPTGPPPGKDGGPDATSARANHQVSRDTTTAPNHSRSRDQQPFDVLAGNARRFAASRRVPPLSPCGCVRDPDDDRHRCHGDISNVMAQAAVTAAIHLDKLGTPGLLNRQTCRAVWRIGYRALAVAVHNRTSGQVA